MVLCSRSSTLLEGAFRRAFFYCGRSQLQFIVLAIVLHAALLFSLQTGTSLRTESWQALSIHLEQLQPVQTVSIASAFSSNTAHALVHVKAKQNAAVVKSGLPKVIAETPSEMPRNELAAERPQTAPPATGPVVGLALPQLGVTGGRHHLWSVQQEGMMPDEQARFQANRQREAQLALQAAQIAEREKSEAQLMRALSDVQLSSLCRVIIPSAKPARIHCENDLDVYAVRTVVNKIGVAPVVPADASALIIDLAPTLSDGAQVVDHRHSSDTLSVD
jgi:hypothetical protein